MTPPVSASTAISSSSAHPSSPSSYLLDEWIEATGQSVPDSDSQRWVSYNVDDLYPDWQERAHCRDVGVGYYFGESIQQVRRASKLCDVCPVFYECLIHALTVREGYGVWAGTSGRMRRQIFKLMDTGQTTVSEVVEVFRNGEGDRYRVPGKSQGLSSQGLSSQGLSVKDPGPAYLPDPGRALGTG
jgi:hypothetical protein